VHTGKAVMREVNVKRLCRQLHLRGHSRLVMRGGCGHSAEPDDAGSIAACREFVVRN
jgi:hypothetical protein